MAEEGGVSSAFPPPPKEFEVFTDANVKAFKEDPASVPESIARVMQPQTQPSKAYSVFGETWQIEDKLPSLQSAGVQQLYADNFELVPELKTLSRSLMLNYLELVTIMSSAPEQFPTKVEHLRLIMINMHHLINSYRPHQTRESLIAIMEQQLARRQLETQEIEQATQAAQEQLDKFRMLEVPVKMEMSTVSLTNGHSIDSLQIEQIETQKRQDLYMFGLLDSIT